MDSLLASYASSDEEEREEQPPPKRIQPAKSESETGERNEDFLQKSTSKRGGIFNSLPPPKSSLFNSLPPPKSQSSSDPKPQSETHSKKTGDARGELIAGNSKPKSSSASLFSSIPQPKASSTSAAPKRVVQFRPPTITNPHVGSLDDEDEDSDDGEEERKRKRSKESINTSSPASFLSSIPAPRNSAAFGALPSASGMSRRSVLETGAPAPSSNVSTVNAPERDAFLSPNVGYSNDQSNDTNYAYSSWGSESESHAYYSGNVVDPNGSVGTAPSSSVSTESDSGLSSDLRQLGGQSNEIYDHSASLGGENYEYYGSGSASAVATGVGTDYEAVDYSYAHGQPAEYTNYGGDYANIAQYENHSANPTALPEVSRAEVENSLQALGRRGRKDVPQEIVEVKQDELMKNRPRQDQVKSTGIAFGPAYQPATTKGKPPKLHKRKHQIGSLYFDMKQKEGELAERRSKGFLTKAQTQAKYGW